MRTAAIIAEYNPFHNGHAWQIRRVRETTLADHVLVVMSGDFTQRGAPAILDKYSRTEAALLCGADAVIELPVRYATGSAEFFAVGAVSLLQALGCVDDLCFGCEDADSIEAMRTIASALNHPTAPFCRIFKDALRQGKSWPQARMLALRGAEVCTDREEKLLTSPNNLLAVEYLRALEHLKSPIRPLAFPRKGAGYHDLNLLTASGDGRTDANAYLSSDSEPSDAACGDARFSSAAAIREAIETAGLTPDALASVPPEMKGILEKSYRKTFPILADDFSGLLHYLLLRTSAAELGTYQDITPDLSNRMLHLRNEFQSFRQFCSLLKSRDLTYSRISRSLTHLLLGISRSDPWDATPEYAHLLGFRKDHAHLLAEIKARGSIPLIVKPASYVSGHKSEDALPAMWKEDLFAANLYSSVAAQKFGCGYKTEYQRQRIVI